MRVLFVIKQNETYGFVSYCRRSSGLFNSTRFIVEGLRERGVEAKIVEVVDNNSIDREVHLFKPTLVILEALWVVPEKFEILESLHPHVKWWVHLHSNMPFLALEGIATSWILDYLGYGVNLIANSEASYQALGAVLQPNDELVYLPNSYRGDPQDPIVYDRHKDTIDVACFGAIRPLKNQLTQALASIEFASKHDKYLCFHINATRSETGGDPILKNLRQLFERCEFAELIEHDWYEPEEFLRVLRTMDIGLQVSLSETFNVVTADYVTAGLPVVVSKEIGWVDPMCVADDALIESIVNRMEFVIRSATLITWNQILLNKFRKKAEHKWYHFVKARHGEG